MFSTEKRFVSLVAQFFAHAAGSGQSLVGSISVLDGVEVDLWRASLAFQRVDRASLTRLSHLCHGRMIAVSSITFIGSPNCSDEDSR